MFDDFNWKELLMSIDALVRNEKYSSYMELTSLTIREIDDIWKIIMSKRQEQELNKALSNKPN